MRQRSHVGVELNTVRTNSIELNKCCLMTQVNIMLISFLSNNSPRL